MGKLGVISMVITGPIIREGDDIVKIAADSLLDAVDVKDDGVFGITESVIARAAGMYVSLDEIANNIRKRFNNPKFIVVANPIYSRNRFSMILKAIARSAAEKVIIFMPEFDEVGNPNGVNRFTGVNMLGYYKEVVEGEGRECVIHKQPFTAAEQYIYANYPVIWCGLHDYENYRGTSQNLITLADICPDKNPDFGLLGTNKATEEKLKLFPTVELAERVCYGVQEEVKARTGKHVHVLVYGDGSYKDLDAGIWEMADPCSSPGYTEKDLLDSTPNEVKAKYLADDKFKDLTGKDLANAIEKEIEANKSRSLKNKMISEGTTPRRYINQLVSLCDLTSGSGQRLTPFIYIENYF